MTIFFFFFFFPQFYQPSDKDEAVWERGWIRRHLHGWILQMACPSTTWT